MPTGYEVSMYRDVSVIAQSLHRLAELRELEELRVLTARSSNEPESAVNLAARAEIDARQRRLFPSLFREEA